MSDDEEIIQLEDLQVADDLMVPLGDTIDLDHEDPEFSKKFDASDLRAEPRLNFMFDVEVFDAVTNEFIGDLVNFSYNGLLLICEKSIEINTSFELKVVIPYEINGKQEIRVKASSVRCNEDSYPMLFNIGFRMTDVEPEEKEIIRIMINEAGC